MKKINRAIIAIVTLMTSSHGTVLGVTPQQSSVSILEELKYEMSSRQQVSVSPTERTTPSFSTSSIKKKKDISENINRFAIRLVSDRNKISSSGVKEKLDSVITSYYDGSPSSKQVFTYTENGLKLNSLNYIWGGTDWMLFSRYSYEYDNLGRLISAEQISDIEPYDNMRYEYFYTDNTSNYTSLIFYYFDFMTQTLAPSQKGEYAYDEEGRPIEQAFWYYDNYMNQWFYSQKETVSFDENGRQTSYFSYRGNDTNDGWKGYTGESYSYLPNGQDDILYKYTWEDDNWLAYERRTFTYRADGKVLKDATDYWNRLDQDWSGIDSYGAWGMMYNYYIDYEYNDNDRLTAMISYQQNSQNEYVNNANDFYSYIDLEDGNYERTHIQEFIWQLSTPTVFLEEVQRFNKFGAETYYKGYTYVSGERRAREEEIRDIDPFTNIYYGGTFYGFTDDEANTRYGSSKEVFEFPDEWDGITNTPSYGMHWKGVGIDTDDTWIESRLDEFTWAGTWMSGCKEYIWDPGDKVVVFDWLEEFDLSIPISEIYTWETQMNGKDLPGKILSSYKYYDYNFDGQWDNKASVNVNYFYSDVTSTGIVLPRLQDKSEVERYDLSGKKVSKDAKGVIIIKYSDGSVSKVMVR